MIPPTALHRSRFLDLGTHAPKESDNKQDSGGSYLLVGMINLPGEQAQEKQPGQSHVQDNRQGDRQGHGLAEQPQDGRPGEDGIPRGVQVIVQPGTQGRVQNPGDGRGDDDHDMQDNGQGDVLKDQLQHEHPWPQQDSPGHGHEPEQNPQQQEEIPGNGTSQNNLGDEQQPVDEVSENQTIPFNAEFKDNQIAYGIDHASTIQDRQRRRQATVDGSPTPEDADDPLPSLAAVNYAGRALGTQAMVRDRISPRSAPAPAPSSIHFQSPANSPAPGIIHTPAVSLSRPRPTPSPVSRPRRDDLGIDSLITAAQLPDPLRLTSRAPDKESLFYTLSLLFAMPGNGQLSPARRGDITNFAGSLFDTASYWTLHNNILRYVEATGFRDDSGHGHESNVDRRDSIASFDSSRTPSVDSRSDSGPEVPPLLTVFAKQWRGHIRFSYQTSTTAVVRLTRMKHEEQCYLHWCTLRAIWKASDPGRDHDSNLDHNNFDDPEGEEDEALSPTLDAAAHLEWSGSAGAENDSTGLVRFLTDQMEQRKSELNLRRSPQYEAHTVRLLKSLVAPFLGLTATEHMWRKTMTMGRAVHAVVRQLGPGALAVLKRESIRCLGPEMLERILPTITAYHPELTQILQTVERVFLELLRGPDPRLRSEDVENFIRIDSMTRMWTLCDLNAHGLNGILGAQPNDDESASAGRHDTTPPLGAVSSELQADPLTNIDNDEEAIYNVQDLYHQGLDRPHRLPAALPTPPPTADRSGGKRKIGPEWEESPTKRLPHRGST
ncbi:MAG: hypothetical protein Q9208_007924 [Pyrenodesmia sp. 3 TL-2023]